MYMYIYILIYTYIYNEKKPYYMLCSKQENLKVCLYVYFFTYMYEYVYKYLCTYIDIHVYIDKKKTYDKKSFISIILQ
jgi:hypothetical protein